jgi:integrase/recombinase XerD
MEKFIIHSKEYRDCYVRFKKYLLAIGYSPSSCKTFEPGIREFLCWVEKKKIGRVDQVEESDIESFYRHLQERPNTVTGGTLGEDRIALNMYVLKIFFRYLQATEQTEGNPMDELNYGKGFRRTRENLLSKEDIEKLYNGCETAKQKAMLGIIYGCGLRRQEAVKLNAKDIHFKNAMLYVREGKGGRKRTIPLSKTVLNDLRDYYFNERPNEINQKSKDIEAFMFNKHGTRMQGGTYSEEMKKLTGKASLDKKISLHYFRHAIATHLLESGMKMEHVKDFLGHMSIETTQTYMHITTTQMKKTTAYGTEKLFDRTL